MANPMGRTTYVAVRMPLEAERAFYLSNAEYRGLVDVDGKPSQTAPWVTRSELLTVLDALESSVLPDGQRTRRQGRAIRLLRERLDLDGE